MENKMNKINEIFKHRCLICNSEFNKYSIILNENEREINVCPYCYSEKYVNYTKIDIIENKHGIKMDKNNAYYNILKKSYNKNNLRFRKKCLKFEKENETKPIFILEKKREIIHFHGLETMYIVKKKPGFFWKAIYKSVYLLIIFILFPFSLFYLVYRYFSKKYIRNKYPGYYEFKYGKKVLKNE